eukprot:TRINITY_DN1426_c0_g1_i2.p1 TRINITY_DN1426_c0_g1~~TRINITY_DN1426_c0_g1_i2.p1  ORF type:complete len:446 (+),score=102.63 TRINITY_DN1426_c0_g1_i2:48-1385(+)
MQQQQMQMMPGMRGGPPILVLNTNTKREFGRKAQRMNIKAAKAVADIIRTCLGPKAMLKMLLDPMGGIVITNDGNAILREIDVVHPAAKSMIELSKTQDEEVGDGTTSVIVLAGEVMAVAESYIEKGTHPTDIIKGFYKALNDSLEDMGNFAVNIDINKNEEIKKIINSAIGTKFISRWAPLMCDLAIDAVKIVTLDGPGEKEIDIKRFVKVEKIPGGEINDCEVLKGVVLNKDVLHSRMRRRIENPRIILLDVGIEPKKLENAAQIDLLKGDDWTKILQAEEDFVRKMCENILAFKPDLVITEKGLSDLAQHYFVKNGVTALRRLRKTDNNRIARAVGATIVSRPEELRESDIGTKCGLFEVRKIGDEYFSFLTDCKEPEACTILLRGASKDVLKEVERNLQDAMCVARNVLLDPRLVPGGGAIEMALATVTFFFLCNRNLTSL